MSTRKVRTRQKRLARAQLHQRLTARRKVPTTKAELEAVTDADIARLLNLSPEAAAALAAMDEDR